MKEGNTRQIFNKAEYKQHRLDLRKNMPEPEKRLWQILRNHQMGVKFRRQHGVEHYIVDFYCPALKLVIEVDGDSHFSSQARKDDKQRDNDLSALGIMTIRVNNNEVMSNIDGVHQYLEQQIKLRQGKING